MEELFANFLGAMSMICFLLSVNVKQIVSCHFLSLVLYFLVIVISLMVSILIGTNIYVDLAIVDGVVHNAPGMLQPGEDLPPLLWSFRPTVLYDQQSVPGEF